MFTLSGSRKTAATFMKSEDLRRIRKEAGLTQEQFSEVTGISVDAIRSIEIGRRKVSKITKFKLNGGKCPVCGKLDLRP